MLVPIFSRTIKKIRYFGFLNLVQRAFILMIALRWFELAKKIILFFTIKLPYLYPIPQLNRKNSKFNVIPLSSNSLKGTTPKRLGKSIGIHLHLYYLDLSDEIIDRLRYLKYPFDLYVSVSEKEIISRLQSLLRKKLPTAKNIIIREVPNTGKDLGPLIVEFGEKLSGYDIVGHFHTKKSGHLKEGLHWYQHILDALLGSVENKNHVNQLVYMLSKKNSVAYPSAYLRMTNSEDGWESDKLFLKNILKQYTAINIKDYPVVEFTQGSMFWSHTSGVKKFLTLPITYKSFNRIHRQNNALEHVLERLILIYASQSKAKLYKMESKVKFSILIQTDQRVNLNEVLPRLNHLKPIHTQGEVLIITDKPIPYKMKSFHINPWIEVKLISKKDRSRARKMNRLLSEAKGEIIILKGDDFEMNDSVIQSHLNFHTEDPSIKSLCFGMAFIKDKTIYNSWLEKRGFLFGIPFKKNASYHKKEIDFFYAANTSMKREIFEKIGMFNDDCEFDCTDDWLMWKEMKKYGCHFFHVPTCDVEHIHDVSIRDRFLALVQTGWNASHLNITAKKIKADIDIKVTELHQALSNNLNHAKDLDQLFKKIEATCPLIGRDLYLKQAPLKDMYSLKRILALTFEKRNLTIPNLNGIERYIKNLG
jgi:hypothetical protein